MSNTSKSGSLGKRSIKSPGSKSPKLKIDSASESEMDVNSAAANPKLPDKNSLRVHLEYSPGEEEVEDFVKHLKEEYTHTHLDLIEKEPTEFDKKGRPTKIFEYHLNEKVVWSYALLKEYPNFDELKEVTYWMDQGKSFMHMYLCSFMEGGEVRMAINDRKNTPLVKRLILTCTIS